MSSCAAERIRCTISRVDASAWSDSLKGTCRMSTDCLPAARKRACSVHALGANEACRSLGNFEQEVLVYTAVALCVACWRACTFLTEARVRVNRPNLVRRGRNIVSTVVTLQVLSRFKLSRLVASAGTGKLARRAQVPLKVRFEL